MTPRLDDTLPENRFTDNLLKLLSGQALQKIPPSSKQLLQSGKDTSDLSTSSLMTTRKAILRDRLRLQFPQISSHSLPDLFPLFLDSQSELAVSWSVQDGPKIRRGWTVDRDLQLGSQHSQLPAGIISASSSLGVRVMYEETNRRKLALTESILGSDLTFSENPILVQALPVDATDSGR